MALFDITNFERQGNTENDIHLDNINDIRESTIQLSSSALRTIKIFTLDLEHNIYDNEIFRKSLLKFTRGNRHAKIHILVSDLSAAIHHGHRLIQLAQKLTSAMQIRNTPEDYQSTDIAFMLIDNKAFIFRHDIKKYNGIYSPDCKYRSQKLSEIFTSSWEYAEKDPQIQRLNI